MSVARSQKPALYTFCDFMIGLGLFALIAIGLAADIAGAWPASQSEPVAKSISATASVSATPMGAAHKSDRAPLTSASREAVRAPKTVAQRAEPKQHASPVLAIEPYRRVAAVQSLSFSDQQWAMLALALMFGAISVAIQQSARHLRSIIAPAGAIHRARR